MWVKILLLFFVFSFLFRTDTSFNQDLGRHLKLGEIIWQTKSVPQTNLFSYTNPDFPFINTHWLFELLLYLGQQTIGLQTILVLKVIIFLLSVWLVLKTIPKNQYLLLPIGFIFLHTLRERPELRPEIFSFLFTALTIYILESRKKLIYLLPFIQLIWVNTHIYFILGLVLQVIYLRSHLTGGKLKLASVIFVLSVIASLINPNGLNALFYPLTVGQNYGYTIVENQTMFFLESINFRDPNFLFVKISLGLIVLSLIAAFFKRRFEIKNILLCLFGAGLALANVRSFPYLALISLPAVLVNFGSFKWQKLLLWLTIPFIFLESFFYLNGDYYKYNGNDAKPGLKFAESGKKALDFLLTNDLPEPIFNNFDIGSYITYRAYPGYKVFVDGRPEGYPKEFFQQVYIPMQSDPEKFAEVEKKYGFKTIIFSHTDQTPWGKAFLQSIVKNPDWKTVYIDDFIIILVKSDLALQGVPLQHVDLSNLDPDEYRFDSYLAYLRLSLFLIQTNNLKSAEKFAKTGLSLFSKSPLGNALFGINVSNNFFW